MDLWSPCGVHMESVGECKVQERMPDYMLYNIQDSMVAYGVSRGSIESTYKGVILEVSLRSERQ